GVLGCLREVGRRLDDSGADWVDEVRPADALYCRPHRVQVEVVSGDRLHALVFQPLRAGVDAVDEGRTWGPFCSNCPTAAPPVSPVAPVIRIFPVTFVKMSIDIQIVGA